MARQLGCLYSNRPQLTMRSGVDAPKVFPSRFFSRNRYCSSQLLSVWNVLCKWCRSGELSIQESKEAIGC